MEIITKATTRCRDLPDVACGLDHDVQGDVEPDYLAQLEEVEQVNHVAAYQGQVYFLSNTLILSTSLTISLHTFPPTSLVFPPPPSGRGPCLISTIL